MTERNGGARNEDDAPEPVRPETMQEREGVAPSQQEDPPKAEGDRDEAESDRGETEAGERADRGNSGSGDRPTRVT